MSLTDVPHYLWRAYVDNLVYYEPGSWVASIAFTFRVLSISCIAPVAFLILLDVTSYVIARTLGVIDDTKASTSDTKRDAEDEEKSGLVLDSANPTILVSDESGVGLADGTLPTPSASTPTLATARAQEAQLQQTVKPPIQGRQRSPSESHSTTPFFFSPHEEHSLQLSGVGVFSPAASRPGSPDIGKRSSVASSRQSSMSLSGSHTFTVVEEEEPHESREGSGLRQRIGRSDLEDAS
jgi:hypothetical protein